MNWLKKVEKAIIKTPVVKGILNFPDDNNHAKARLAYIAYLNRKNSIKPGVHEEALECLREVESCGGLNEDDINKIKRELSVPLAWR